MKVSKILTRWVAVVILVAGAGTTALAQRGKWWQDEQFRRELALTAEQSARLEAIFQKTQPTLRERMQTLNQAEDQLDRLIEKGDDASVLEYVGVVESARAELNKTRTMMLPDAAHPDRRSVGEVHSPGGRAQRPAWAERPQSALTRLLHESAYACSYFDAVRPSAHLLPVFGLQVLAAPATLLAQGATDERTRLDEIARVAAQQFVAARNELEQTRPTAPQPPPGTPVDLTLEEATARALERNLELAVERLNPQTFDLTIARIRAAYQPTATSTFNQRAVTQPPTNQLNGGNIVQNDTTDFNAGILQALPGGGDVSFQFNNRKQVTSNIFANFNPTFTSNFNLTLTQPLLRGFLIDNNRQQLRVTAISRDISEIQLRGTIATTLSGVRNAYWELLYAIDAVEVARGR